MNILLIAIYVVLTSGGLIAIKLSSGATQHSIQLLDKLSIPFNWWLLTGVVLYGLSFITYILLISRFELGYIIPLTTALVYIVIFAASFAIFKESFTALKVAGIVLIIAGLVLLNIKS